MVACPRRIGYLCMTHTTEVRHERDTGKNDRTPERVPPYAARVPRPRHPTYILACAGRHTRHYGRAGAARFDADRFSERHEKRIRRRGADRVHQFDSRREKRRERRRNRDGKPGTGADQIFQRTSLEAAHRRVVRRRSSESRTSHRRDSVLSDGRFRRAGGRSTTSRS